MKFIERLKGRLQDPAVGAGTILLVSFLESTVVPIPIEFALIPLMAAARDRLWWIATVALAGTILGAVAGYGLGYFFWDLFGQSLAERFGILQEIQHYSEELRANGFPLLVSAGVTPIPYKIVSVSAGIAGYNFLLFLLATAIARGVRYWGLALLVHFFGRRAGEIIKRHKTSAVVITSILMAVIIVWSFAA